MTVQPLTGFRHVETHHCVTGSMRHLYLFNEYDISEEMLLGLGGGVGFIYWHQKGQTPFFGGRAAPKPSLEVIAGQRTGVCFTEHTTSSDRKAEKVLIDLLESGQPVMLQVDMGFLPYFDFGDQEYHFGGHVVVACGYNPDTCEVLIADRDAELHPVHLADLAKARGSAYKPFPPCNKWYSTDFSQKRPPTGEDIYTALGEQVAQMLNPPISNIGVEGIAKAARLVPQWPDVMDEEKLRFALFNAYIFISPVGGSGGGTFRYMFSRFLLEAAQLTGNPALEMCADSFRQIGDRWEAVAAWCHELSEAPDPAACIADVGPMLETIAGMERTAWADLCSAIQPVEAAVVTN